MNWPSHRDRQSSRRAMLAGGVVAFAGWIAALGGVPQEADQAMAKSMNQPVASPVPDDARLMARPGIPAEVASPGLRHLGLDPDRDALLYVPAGYQPDRPAPFVLSLHGAGGSAEGGLYPLHALTDEAGLILLAPASRGPTWDVILGGYGPDVAFIERALEIAFARCAVDPARIGVSGFSDGASYALSLGITNGDLFQTVMAFSPGFMAPTTRRGRPRIFVSHGTNDDVLPIDVTSRRIVPQLESAGYDVRYREFNGGHTVPPDIARDALDWFLVDRSSSTPVPGTPLSSGNSARKRT